MAATVPPGTTAGPVRVRTKVGVANSAQPFQAVPLTTGAVIGPSGSRVWPNPARVGEPWQVQLAAATLTQFEVRSLLGQVVFQTQLRSQALRVPVPPLALGVYQLTLRSEGQSAWQQRVVVVE
jgi:hypothetical protein